MRKNMCLLLLCLSLFRLSADTAREEKGASPHIFHNIGWNFVHSVSYNYGLNFIGAGAGTWAMIRTGIDWNWRNFIFDREPLITNAGGPVMSVGGIVPVVTPLAFLVAGKSIKNEKLVITASALTQTLILTMAIQSPLKMITGRRDPGLVDNNFYTRTYGESDFSAEFNWFNMDFFNGWPSGHTANAFSAAAALSELYHDSMWVKAGAFGYAVLIGLGVTMHAHWASEAVAGALIGYAIGKTVGKSYRVFLDKNRGDQNDDKNQVSFYCTPGSAGITIRI